MSPQSRKAIFLIIRVFVCFLFALVVGIPTGIVNKEFYGPNAGLVIGLISGLCIWLVSFMFMLKDYYYRSPWDVWKG